MRELAELGAGGGCVGVGIKTDPTLGADAAPLADEQRAAEQVDAGDLLATSPTPGHAMKVADRSRAPEAIVGKALKGAEARTGDRADLGVPALRIKTSPPI